MTTRVMHRGATKVVVVPGPVATASILLIDDHALFTDALTSVLATCDGVGRLTKATTGEEGIASYRERPADLVLCDLALPGISGLDVLRAIRAINPSARVCILSANGHQQVVADAIAAGCCGYLSKTAGVTEFVDKVLRALQGEQVYDASTATDLIASMNGGGVAEVLPPRQSQVLNLLADGLSYDEIAEVLHVAPSTVKTHSQALYRRLNVNDRVGAVAEGFRLGLLT